MKSFKPIIYITLLLCVSIGIGALAAGKMADDEPSAPVEVKTKVSEERQLKILVFSTIHSKCGHTTQYTDNIPVEYYSVNELAASFPNWEITGGDEKTLIFTRHTDDFCPSHYTAKSNGNKIIITADQTETVVYEFYTTPDFMSDEDKSALKKGVHLSGKDALTSFIEDYTS
jgi:hypothetical protein